MLSSALLCCLVFLARVGASQHHNTPSENSCIHFPDDLPNMLQEIRAAFNQVRIFFQSEDKLDSMLLNGSLKEDLKGYLGCQALSEMISFYLEKVMPQAESQNLEIKAQVNSLGERLKTLKQQLWHCHHYLPCVKKSKAMEQVKKAFNQLQDKGVYKAMSEFDIFINYIEEYMTRKMRK
ncbi:interleukin-10 [Saccopteryx bilineata]|uniref:interleukin-10 n=1 Tax=Saccopteryx bilineata TaxID=59482 RepID=UPI00338E05B1